METNIANSAMGVRKYVIACPKCGAYTEASKGFFGIGATRKIHCGGCGSDYSVKEAKMTTRECPHCGNGVIFDQTKGEEALCPVCKNPINTRDSLGSMTEIICPSCGCSHAVNKSASEFLCPLCDTVINVQQQIAAKEAKKGGMPSVIECKTDNTIFVKRHPIDNFVTGSRLIVHESQEAVFFKDGTALDTFGPGAHMLTTDKMPMLTDALPSAFGNGDPFRTEVYFINMTEQKEIKWGTPNKIGIREPKYNMPIEIGAFGTFNMVVSNPRKFLIKNIGTIDEFRQSNVMGDSEYSTVAATGQFTSLILNKVENVLSNTIGERGFDIFQLDAKKEELSAAIREVINEQLDDYGLFMPQFYIRKISLPEDDPNFKRLRENVAAQSLNSLEAETAETERAKQITRASTAADVDFIAAQNEARKKLLMEQTLAAGEQAHGEAKANVMKAQGFTYQQESARQVGMEAMKNGIVGGRGDSDSGSFGDALGLGVALGAMGGIANMTRDVMNPLINTASDIGTGIGNTIGGVVQGAASSWNCNACGAMNIVSKFCPECGAPRPEAAKGWECPNCGCKNITSKFCPECGAKKPEPPETWDCPDCGCKSISSKFCPDCGRKKPDTAGAWDCECGCKGITSKCCPDCGKKRPEAADSE